MKQNVSIPFWVISSKKAADQRASSLIKRFGVLARCFFQGVGVSLAEVRAGVPAVWEGASSALDPPANLPPRRHGPRLPVPSRQGCTTRGVRRNPVTVPPAGHPRSCGRSLGGCLSGGSFAVKSPKKQKVKDRGRAQANLCQMSVSQLRKRERTGN